MRSSTSSSERSSVGFGFPRAVAGAVLIILAVELVLHLVPHESLLGYGEGLGTYYEVKHTIEDRGAAPIAILGESRAQEAVIMPELTAQAGARLGRAIVAANYACPDAKASDMLLITKAMLASRSKPQLVLYLISPRGLLGTERSVQREEVFGVFPNQHGEGTAQVLASLSEYPMWQARNVIQEHYLTFRHRYRFRNYLATTLRGRRSTSPIQGEETIWQRYQPNRSLVTNPVSDRQIQEYVARLLDADGRYPLGDRHIDALREIGRLCRENSTELVLVSAPIAADLERHLPAGTMKEFDRVMRDVAREFDVPYLTADELGVAFDRADFREQSHLNRQGAEKMTAALVEQVIVPAFGTASAGMPAGTHSGGAFR